MKYFTLIILFLSTIFSHVYSQETDKRNRTLVQPYPPIKAVFSGKKIAHSPDPLSGYRWENPEATDGLEIYTLYPVTIQSDKPCNFKADKHLSTIHITGDCSLMFDFGQVNAGWLEFDSENLEADVEMSISEFNEPAVFNIGSEHPVKTARPIKYGNIYRLELNKGLYEGVRFGWIHIKKLNKPADLSAIRLVCQIKPTNYEGSFSCSDTTLTRIWYTGAYTVKLNLLKDYFGAILMERSDRHSWTGDAHTSQAASMVAFGNYDFVKTNLLYTSTQYNGIASYSLYWVLSLIDYFNYTGDEKLVNELLDNACKKLDTAYGHYGQNPSISFCGWDERLGGFENPTQEAQALYKMLSIRTWNEFSKMMKQTGHPELAAKYSKYTTEKIKELRKDEMWMKPLGTHSASDAINAGFTNKYETKKLWESALSDRQQRLSYSPFNQYFIITALARMGRIPEALNTVYDCWGGQLAYGGTTFFEVFRPSWNTISSPNDPPINNQCGYTSLTHPWSAGITKWLSEEILGIKPTAPGFSTCLIKPGLSAGLTWVEGSVPTPLGKITASFNTTNGTCNINIPQGVKTTVGIPKVGKTIKNIHFEKGRWNKIKEDRDFIYYTVSTGENLAIINYTGESPLVPSETFSYPLGTDIKEDGETQGNWKAKYGSKGYMLCNYDSTGTNLYKLPEFISNIEITRAGNQHWTNSTTDTRALVSPDSRIQERSIGAITTKDPGVCDQTMTIDIKSCRGETYTVSLYFVDWDKQNRKSAVEVFDLASKELLKPVYMVKNYENGKYITYTFKQPVRFRINQVRGTNAALSGIFFN